MATAVNRRHKKTGTVAGFSVYPRCIERHLESMFGAPRETRDFHMFCGVQPDYTVWDTRRDKSCGLLPMNARHRVRFWGKRL